MFFFCIITGRRGIPLIWTPEKTPTTAVRLRTPTIQTTTMTLRSSPRKRLLLDEFGPTTPEKYDTSSPRKSNTSPKIQFYQTSKRLRFDEKPIVQLLPSTPLSTSLKALSHAQLLDIINGLVSKQPELEQKIRKEMPMPDIKHLEDQLNAIKKNIFKSLPTSRLVSKTDSNGFSRASIHLTMFRKVIDDQCRLLHDTDHWDALLDYCKMAWSYVKATPIWNHHTHNATRRNCFKILAYYCLEAIKYGGIYLGEQRLKDFSNRIDIMAIDYDDILQCKLLLACLMV